MGQKLFSVTPSPLFIFASNVNDGKNVNVINVLKWTKESFRKMRK